MYLYIRRSSVDTPHCVRVLALTMWVVTWAPQMHKTYTPLDVAPSSAAAFLARPIIVTNPAFTDSFDGSDADADLGAEFDI